MENQNSNTFKELRNVLNANPLDNIPRKVGDTILPVVDLNPFHNMNINLCKSGIATNATATTIYTTPTDKDFYLFGGILTMIKDVTATSTQSYLKCVFEDGSLGYPSSIIGLSLTAQSDAISCVFPFPAKLQRGSIISVNNSTNVGNVSSNGVIFGSIVEPV